MHEFAAFGQARVAVVYLSNAAAAGAVAAALPGVGHAAFQVAWPCPMGGEGVCAPLCMIISSVVV